VVKVYLLVACSAKILLAAQLSETFVIGQAKSQIGQFGPETAKKAINKGCQQPIVFEHFVVDTISMPRLTFKQRKL